MFRKILFIIGLLGNAYSPSWCGNADSRPKPQKPTPRDLDTPRELPTTPAELQRTFFSSSAAERFFYSSRQNMQNIMSALLNTQPHFADRILKTQTELIGRKMHEINVLTSRLKELEGEITQVHQMLITTPSDTETLELRIAHSQKEIGAIHLELMKEFDWFLKDGKIESEKRDSIASSEALSLDLDAMLKDMQVQFGTERDTASATPPSSTHDLEMLISELAQMQDCIQREFDEYKTKYPERVAAYQVTIPTSADGTEELEMHLRDEAESDLSVKAKHESDRKESDTGSTTPQKTLSSHPSGSESSSAEKKDAAELTVEETEAELAAEVQEWIKQKKEERRAKPSFDIHAYNMKLLASDETRQRDLMERKYSFRLEEFFLILIDIRIQLRERMLGEYTEEEFGYSYKPSSALNKIEEDEQYKRNLIDFDYIFELYHIIDTEEAEKYRHISEALLLKDSKDGQ